MFRENSSSNSLFILKQNEFVFSVWISFNISLLKHIMLNKSLFAGVLSLNTDGTHPHGSDGVSDKVVVGDINIIISSCYYTI